MTSCMICGGPGRTFEAREMMFGRRDQFRYLECGACGCLGLIDPPADPDDSYPPSYYAFAPTGPPARRPTNPVRRWAMLRRNEAQIFGAPGPWGLVARRRPRPDLQSLASMLGPVPPAGFRGRVLDVGCGGGELLTLMHEAGFRSLTGVDPLLPSGRSPGPGFRIVASTLDALHEGPFDLIMFHHSLEHMPSQVGALEAAAARLAPGGTCLVRVPVASADGWGRYGPDWVELDAPRHVCLHSPASLAMAARRAGLEVYRTRYDSTGFTHWGSEMYRRGIPLHDAERGGIRRPEGLFGADELANYEAEAAAANSAGVGGRAAFYLRRAAP